MSKRLPALTADEVIRVLKAAGFVVVRMSGSHRRLVHRDDSSRATTVPCHGGKTLKRGAVRAIVEQAGLGVDEFLELMG